LDSYARGYAISGGNKDEKETLVVPIIHDGDICSDPFAGAFPTEAQKKASIAVLPFTVNSQENIDYVKQGVWDMLISRLSMNDSLSVVSKDQVSSAIRD